MFLGNSDIFTLVSPNDCYYHQSDTNTEKNIGQSEVRHIMTLSTKTKT